MTDLFEQPQGLFDSDGQTLTANEIEKEKESLAARIAAAEADESRANPYHDGKSGKFASKTTAKTQAHVDLNSPDGKKLVTVTKKWQGQPGEVEKIQADFMTRAGGKATRSKQRDEHMRVLKDGIKNSPTNEEVLYRGVRVPKGTDVHALKGSSFVIPPSSFTSKDNIARQFVDRSQGASTTVMYRVPKGKARGLYVAKMGDPNYGYEEETISAGQFKITNVEKLAGNKGFIVDVEHTAMFDWKD